MLLNGNCQPSGQQFNLTATFGLDYTASLGTAGTSQCIRSSQLVLTSFDLQGLPGPLSSLAQPLVQREVPNRIQPRVDELAARRLNGGNLPPSGARCPGS